MSDSKDRLQPGESYPSQEELNEILSSFITEAGINGKAVERLKAIPTNVAIQTPTELYHEIHEALKEGFSGKSRIHERHGDYGIEFVAEEIRPQGERQKATHVIAFVEERVDLTKVKGESVIKDRLAVDSEIFEPDNTTK